MELNEALAQITEIRSHLARTEVFRGFRSITVASSAGIALLAGLLQAAVFPSATENVTEYLVVWISAAGLSVSVACIAIACRAIRSSTRLERETTLLALQQFAPCLLAGAVLTASLYSFAPESCWLLPALWSIVFSLGVFACYRSIDSSIFLVAAYYLLAGMAILVLAPHERAFSPWVMAGTFATGQLLTAALLYWRLERNHA